MAELQPALDGEDGPTDVLAFPMDELRPGLVNEEPEEGVLGDIVLCPSVAAAAGEDGRPLAPRDELQLLTVHGILHLLGYDHAEPDEHKEMFGLQAQLLGEWRRPRGRSRLRPSVTVTRDERTQSGPDPAGRRPRRARGRADRAPRPRSRRSRAPARSSWPTSSARAPSACCGSLDDPARYLNAAARAAPARRDLGRRAGHGDGARPARPATAGARCWPPSALMSWCCFVVVGVAPRTIGRQHAESIALATRRRRARRSAGCSARCRAC